MACLSPAGSERWYQQILTDIDAGLETEKRVRLLMDHHLAPLSRRHGFSNQAVDKLLAAIGRWADIGARLRWPYKGVDIDVADRLRPVVKRLLPEFFE